VINAHYEPIPFVLPGQEHLEWQLILDTMDRTVSGRAKKIRVRRRRGLGGRSSCLFQLVSGTQRRPAESWKKRRGISSSERRGRARSPQ
jgi:hypothetical protein